MAILTGPEIKYRMDKGFIDISPYNPSNIQPNSIDVTLGTGVCVYKNLVEPYPPDLSRYRSMGKSRNLYLQNCGEWGERDPHLDTKKDNPVYRYEMDDSGWLLKPGILYLMHVNEVLHAPDLVMTLDGKSSLARLGIIIHFTAGHAETGFHGQYTMEVSAMHPVKIYPGMDIAQVIFHTVEGQVADYKLRGNYVGEKAMGAQPSRSWRQFK